jgi:soluble lytic murein transglycosylase-like protein
MKLVLPVLAALALCTSEPVRAAGTCEREMAAAAQKYAVPLGVLYAVGLTESGKRQSLQPFAMNIAGTAYYASGIDDALRRFDEGRAAGTSLIDVGCMQIDYRWHGDQFPSVAAMFDPHANVDYGARLLRRLYSQEGTWTLAVARYHAGPDNDPAQKRYVCAVITNMVATGFANWTDGARAFCA